MLTDKKHSENFNLNVSIIRKKILRKIFAIFEFTNSIYQWIMKLGSVRKLCFVYIFFFLWKRKLYMIVFSYILINKFKNMLNFSLSSKFKKFMKKNWKINIKHVQTVFILYSCKLFLFFFKKRKKQKQNQSFDTGHLVI